MLALAAVAWMAYAVYVALLVTSEGNFPAKFVKDTDTARGIGAGSETHNVTYYVA